MTNIDAVRLKTSDKSLITRRSGKGDGVARFFKLDHAPILLTPPIEVRKNDIPLVVAAEYTVDTANGIVTFTSIPAVNDELEFVYYWSAFSDDEVTYFINEAAGNITVASARLLLAWAADAAKLAKRGTMSGGGGLGQVVYDSSVAAKELRATAKALIENEALLGDSIPAEGLTEVPWTEQMYKRQLDQSLIRNRPPG